MINQTMSSSRVLVVTAAGLLSGLLTICISYANARFPAQFLLGLPFGIIISICLSVLGVLSSFRRIARLIVLATLAYFVAFIVAYFFQGIVVSPFMTSGERLTFSPIAMFVGGAIGGFLVIGEAAFFSQMETKQRALKLALLWSLGGGILGVVGEVLGPLLGQVLLSFIRGLRLASLTNLPADVLNGADQTERLFSLYVIWQTGIALLIGLALHRYQARTPVKEANSDES